MNFARVCNWLVVAGILINVLSRGGGSPELGFVALFCFGLGVVLGVLSLLGYGRPAGEPYKAPWIALTLGFCLLLVVVIAAVTTAGRRPSPAVIPPAGGPVIDRVQGFRLDEPGEGWAILPSEQVRSLNQDASAGVQRRPDVAGFVFVEAVDPAARVAGREQEVGERLIGQMALDDKRVVYNRAVEVEGERAVRYQVVGKKGDRELRFEGVALVRDGRLYRLVAFGPSDQTPEDGSAFQPFIAAFHLIPAEPPAVPVAPPAPHTRR